MFEKQVTHPLGVMLTCLVYFMLTNHRPYNVTGGSIEDMAKGTRQFC